MTTLINWYYSVTEVTLHSRKQIFSFWVTESKKKNVIGIFPLLISELQRSTNPRACYSWACEHVDSKAVGSAFQKTLLTWINSWYKQTKPPDVNDIAVPPSLNSSITRTDYICGWFEPKSQLLIVYFSKKEKKQSTLKGQSHHLIYLYRIIYCIIYNTS